jgi:pimeloyl-ACP methyl ester carboxylesterase
LALKSGGDPEEAVAMFLTAVFGMGRDAWEPLLDQRAPGSFAQAVKDADAFFTSELPGVSAWTFGPDEGSRVGQPSLLVLGSDSEPWFVASFEQYRSWLPVVETAQIDGAGHALQLQQPQQVAAVVADFLKRHPAGGA